jgi:anti-sigma regulatory factor (Ser/Thr protein kinase)
MYDVELTLAPTVESVRIGRQLVRQTLTWIDRDHVEIAAILTDEVVANAIKHGRPPIELRLKGDGGRITISVADNGPGRPVVRDTAPTAESGRGMRIVDVLSDEWGVVPLAPGKRVWFQLDVGRL